MERDTANYFKGYVPTKNKQCQMKFKDAAAKDLLTLDEVQKYSEFAGIIANDMMFVDIDDFEQSEILYQIVQDLGLKCRVYKTTRGKHFFFKNKDVSKSGSKLKLAVGLTADIKIGKNSYSILRFNGVDREILLDCDDPQEIPRYLTPIKGASIDFMDMEEGDGRNQSLFNYILTLQAADFTKRAARECIRLMNRYVLKEPLEEGELDVILRDEAFAKDVFYREKTFLFDKFALALKNNCNIIKIFGQLHLYQNGIYISGKEKIEYEMLRMYPQMNRAKRNEVHDYLKVWIQEEVSPMNANLIAFRNGIYDIASDTLMSFSPDYIITNRIEWDFNPAAKCAVADEVLNNVSCKDKDIRALLEEIVGYCFYRRNELGKAFILTGEKNNGKSTYLEMIGCLLGEKNTCALDLAQLNEKFSIAEIFGKLANIGDDISDEYISNTGNFKKLVTGNQVKGEYKGEQPFFFKSYAKLLFSANSIPRLGKGKDAAAIMRRLIIVPFDARFDPKDPNFKPFIKDELFKQETIEYLIMLGIAGLKRVLINRGFTESVKVEKSIEEYEETNNPILGFFKEMEAEDEIKIENEPTADIYKKYCEYCVRSGLQAMGSVEFSRQTCRHFGLKTVVKRVQGKTQRVFVTDVVTDK